MGETAHVRSSKLENAFNITCVYIYFKGTAQSFIYWMEMCNQRHLIWRQVGAQGVIASMYFAGHIRSMGTSMPSGPCIWRHATASSPHTTRLPDSRTVSISIFTRAQYTQPAVTSLPLLSELACWSFAVCPDESSLVTYTLAAARPRVLVDAAPA